MDISSFKISCTPSHNSLSDAGLPHHSSCASMGNEAHDNHIFVGPWGAWGRVGIVILDAMAGDTLADMVDANLACLRLGGPCKLRIVVVVMRALQKVSR